MDDETLRESGSWKVSVSPEAMQKQKNIEYRIMNDEC
jgi:hypothetical protein